VPATYGDLWRTVRLYVPGAPTFLCREWVNVAYKALARSRSWGFLRGELRLTIQASRSLASVSVINGSATVTSIGLFGAADGGRQFAVGTFPVYTIQTVVDANTIVLDRAYGEPTSGMAVAKIFDAYATMPADFGSFRVIADPYNERRLAFWIHEDQLNLLDPIRRTSDTGPRLLAARAPSTYIPTLGRMQYEYWPQPTQARSYPALYNIQADNLVDGDTLTGVLGDGGQVLIDGALAQAARWPGTTDLPNPYFNIQLASVYDAHFREGIQKLSLKDDAIYPDDLQQVHWERWPLGDLAYNDQSLRASDASVADLY
jgi:hypothetical protein